MSGSPLRERPVGDREPRIRAALAAGRIPLARSRYTEYRDATQHPDHRECGADIIAAGIACRHVISFFPFGPLGLIRKLLVQPEGLARNGFEGQTTRVVGDRWGVPMRRLAVG